MYIVVQFTEATITSLCIPLYWRVQCVAAVPSVVMKTKMMTMMFTRGFLDSSSVVPHLFFMSAGSSKPQLLLYCLCLNMFDDPNKQSRLFLFVVLWEWFSAEIVCVCKTPHNYERNSLVTYELIIMMSNSYYSGLKVEIMILTFWQWHFKTFYLGKWLFIYIFLNVFAIISIYYVIILF